MRRISLLYLVLVGSNLITAPAVAQPAANERLRASVFRSLTSESPAAHTSVGEPRSMPKSAATAPVPKIPSVAQRPVVTQAVYAQPVNGVQPNRTAGFYAGNAAQATLSRFPRRAPIQTGGSKSVKRPTKPFTRMQHDPTISPWLLMDQDEDDTLPIPNYITLIRPQQAQIQTNHHQQRELWNLQGQVQGMSNLTLPPQTQTARPAGMGSPARYMETAQFYRGTR